MVEDPAAYAWSSAAAHCGLGAPDPWLETEPFTSAWQPAEWREFLSQAGATEEVDDIRENMHTGRPLGTPEFVLALEERLGRRLAAQRGGRRPRPRRTNGSKA